jgi:hypothetical protein
MEFFVTNEAQAETILQAEIKKSNEQAAYWEKNTAQLKAIQRDVERSEIKAAATKRMLSNGLVPPPGTPGGKMVPRTPGTPGGKMVPRTPGIQKDLGVTKKKRVRTKKCAQSPECVQEKKDDLQGEESQGKDEPALSAATNDLVPGERSQPNSETVAPLMSVVDDGFECELRAMEL